MHEGSRIWALSHFVIFREARSSTVRNHHIDLKLYPVHESQQPHILTRKIHKYNEIKCGMHSRLFFLNLRLIVSIPNLL